MDNTIKFSLQSGSKSVSPSLADKLSYLDSLLKPNTSSEEALMHAVMVEKYGSEEAANEMEALNAQRNTTAKEANENHKAEPPKLLTVKDENGKTVLAKPIPFILDKKVYIQPNGKSLNRKGVRSIYLDTVIGLQWSGNLAPGGYSLTHLENALEYLSKNYDEYARSKRPEDRGKGFNMVEALSNNDRRNAVLKFLTNLSKNSSMCDQNVDGKIDMDDMIHVWKKAEFKDQLFY